MSFATQREGERGCVRVSGVVAGAHERYSTALAGISAARRNVSIYFFIFQSPPSKIYNKLNKHLLPINT